MVDHTADQDLGTEEAAAEAPPAKGGGRTKLVLLIALPLLLLAGAAGGLYASGAADKLLAGVTAGGEAAEAEAGAAAGPGFFYDLPVMLVNLNSSGRESSFLKLSVSLEVAGKSDAEHLEAVEPRIVDSFQVYLRELRIDDLRGSAGLQRLREELLLRVRAAAGGAEVRDVLFKEMLVQ